MDVKRLDARGFTLAELMVVLALLALGSGMAVTVLASYQKHARSMQNQAGAHRVYQAAEAGLAELKSNGRLAWWLQAAQGEADTEEGTLCTLYLDREHRTGAAWLLLGEALTEEQLDAAICLQVDVESGHLAAVFYDAAADAFGPDPAEDAQAGCWTADLPAGPAAAPTRQEALLWGWATPEEAD